MISHVVPSVHRHSGPRALDLRRDMKQVAQIIEEAFGAEMDETGQAALRELHMASRIGPILNFLLPAGARPQDLLGGFVWDEAGKVVGNVTIQPMRRQQDRFLIANVAVQKAWRGYGIGAALMQTALNYIAEQGGTWAVLQVRASNDLARGMYQRLGFVDMLEEYRLRIEQVPEMPAVVLPSGLDLRPLTGGDWHAVRYLIHRAMPVEAHWWYPQRSRYFHEGQSPAWQQSLSRWLGLRHKMRWGLFDDETLMGVLDVAVSYNERHHIDLLLHPKVRDEWSEPLLRHALAYLGTQPLRPVLALLHDYQPKAVETLLQTGFRRVVTLVNMRKRIIPKQTPGR